jgi:DME family drug/metabolite transporter
LRPAAGGKIAGMKTSPETGMALVLLAAAMWGTTGTAQTFASGELPATWFGALRLVVASLFFAAYAAVTLRGRVSPVAGGLRLGPVLAAGLCMAVYNLAFFAGVRGTGVAVGTAVALGSSPVWAGLLQAVWLRRVPAPAWWLGTGVAVAGGVLMTLGGGARMQISTGGVLLCLLSGLAYAAYSLLNQVLVRTASSAALTLGAFSLAALLAVPAAWWDSGWPALQPADMAAIAYVGVVTAGVAYLLYSHALRHISAATGVTLTLGEPVMAFVMAVTVVGERPGLLAFAGLLLVLAGVLQVMRVERQR